jgi:hypothetical protein
VKLIVWYCQGAGVRFGRLRGTRLGVWSTQHGCRVTWTVTRASRAAFTAIGAADYPPWTRRDWQTADARTAAEEADRHA